MKNLNPNRCVVKETEFSFDDEPPSAKKVLAKDELVTLKQIDEFLDRKNGETIKPSAKSLQFLKAHFPTTTESDWRSWHWQVRNSFKSTKQLKDIVTLSDEESATNLKNRDSLPIRITPYYASLIDKNNHLQPLRRSVIPVVDEFYVNLGEASDPLHEANDSPVPNLVHRYPDRVLFLATGFCSTYCRYCTRSHLVAKEEKCHFGIKDFDKAFDYIEKHTEIRDVILSGGDPLTMTDDKIDYLLSRLRKIEHVEIIRIGTKVPVVLPQRITTPLIDILKKYHPLFMSIHFTHPDEITPEVKEACERLANAGIPLGSQTVLLKHINDDVETMKKLVHGLLKIRVRPYYLYQCDPILGSGHFRTSIEKGLEIIQGLRGFTSGYAVPHYVIDAPGGGGKIPILPEYYLGRAGSNVLLRNYEGRVFQYPDAVK